MPKGYFSPIDAERRLDIFRKKAGIATNEAMRLQTQRQFGAEDLLQMKQNEEARQFDLGRQDTNKFDKFVENILRQRLRERSIILGDEPVGKYGSVYSQYNSGEPEPPIPELAISHEPGADPTRATSGAAALENNDRGWLTGSQTGQENIRGRAFLDRERLLGSLSRQAPLQSVIGTSTLKRRKKFDDTTYGPISDILYGGR